MQYLLLFHSNNGYTNMPQGYVICTLLSYAYIAHVLKQNNSYTHSRVINISGFLKLSML